jgi:hypothetical protein
MKKHSIKNESSRRARSIFYPLYLLLAGSLPLLAATNVELGDPNLSPDPEVPSRLAVSLKKTAVPIVGLQFDLVYASGLASPGIPTLRDESSGQKLDVRLVEPGRYRVVLFSSANKPLVAPYSVDLRFGFTEEAPEGGPAMRLENVLLAGEDGSKYELFTTTYGPIGSWRNTNFSEATWNNKATGGDSGDADGDGLRNLEEFYFGTNPRSGEAGAAEAVVSGTVLPDSLGGRILRLTWNERKSVVGVKPVVRGGVDPANLTDVISPISSGEDSAFRNLKAEAPVGEDVEAYFLELRVTRE